MQRMHYRDLSVKDKQSLSSVTERGTRCPREYMDLSPSKRCAAYTPRRAGHILHLAVLGFVLREGLLVYFVHCSI